MYDSVTCICVYMRAHTRSRLRKPDWGIMRYMQVAHDQYHAQLRVINVRGCIIYTHAGLNYCGLLACGQVCNAARRVLAELGELSKQLNNFNTGTP